MVKVSVIVPVYNPGTHLDRCLTSLLGQTLDGADYEVIFVDDGSTDGSAATLDRAAARHPRLRVFHQPNSGWPGQPRNRGIDAARGDYVFFCDDDDWLAPYALEVLHRFALANGSDIVLGKMAGIGRPVPQVVFTDTRPVATLADTPLMDSLTVHKLFRRAFLNGQGRNGHSLRFAEGRRRLEDHLFMAQAYLEASVISVYAEDVCYFHARWASNASRQPPHWPSYFTDLEEAVEAVEQRTEAGPFRDRLLSRWLRVEMVGRLSGESLRKRRPYEVAALFDAAHRVAATHFGEGVVARLNPTDRPVGRAIVAGTLAEIWERAAAVADWRLEPRLLQAGWSAGILQLCGTIGIVEHSSEPAGGSEARLAALFSDVESPALNAALVDSAPALDLENRQTGERFALPARFHGTGSVRSFTVDLDPAVLPPGEPGAGNRWALHGQFSILGLGGRAPVRLVDERQLHGPLARPAEQVRSMALVAGDRNRVELRIGCRGERTDAGPARPLRRALGRARRYARRALAAVRRRLRQRGLLST